MQKKKVICPHLALRFLVLGKTILEKSCPTCGMKEIVPPPALSEGVLCEWFLFRSLKQK